jgi:hypothetical protein
MYTTPKCCYKKAPVRRETWMERKHRTILHQIPPLRSKILHGNVTINKDLVPGEAKYIKEVSNYG